jgi:uncharacterized protein (TIGR00730 family)
MGGLSPAAVLVECGSGLHSGRSRLFFSMAKSRRMPRDPELQRRIQLLLDYQGGGHNADLVKDIIENTVKLLKDVEDRGDVRIIQTALRELRYAFKVFAPYTHHRKVAVFGSARTAPDQPIYQHAVEFGRQIAQAGFMVITGAGPGIMQACHEGAGSRMSFGVNICLPWEQIVNPVISRDNKLVTFKYFFTRKLTFIRHSDALVLFPGGFGTMDEGFEALNLMQTGKSQLVPLVLVDCPGGTYWKTWNKNVREHLLRNQLISPEDLSLYQITERTEQAVQWITRFYRNYHSSRYIKDQLVIRLQHEPAPMAVAALQEDFHDIVKSGKIEVARPAPEELADHEVVDLPRLSFHFNRKNFGRLRQMIDHLNLL